MRLLVEAQVDLVVIGGIAMLLRSADYVTFDIDICYERSPENVERLCRALAPHCLAIRAAFTDVAQMLVANIGSEPFKTDLGRIDVLGEVTGLGNYAAVLGYAKPAQLEGFTVQALTLDGLIKAKEAANRDKDQVHLVTLRALKQMEDEEAGLQE